LTFEAGSRLSNLGASAFEGCEALQSIRVPSSVETIDKSCFAVCRTLSNLTFAPGSKLSTLGKTEFLDCVCLESISIPGGVRDFSGLVLAGSAIRTIVFEAPNTPFRVSGDFLVESDETCLARYLGNDSEVLIRKEVTTIGTGCFSRLASLLSVTFECGSRLSVVGASAFQGCVSVKSICIPASVQAISERCFARCEALHIVTFEVGCRVSVLGVKAFFACSSLESICVHSSVETISKKCFRFAGLIAVTFEAGCQLSVLSGSPFRHCESLKAICIPRSIEEISGRFSGIASSCRNWGSNPAVD
jgi:hypothetical protein